MPIDSTTIIALICFLGASITGLVAYVKALLTEQIADCREGRKACEARSLAQQAQIDALIDGDHELARAKRLTEVVLVLPAPSTRHKRRLLGILSLLTGAVGLILSISACTPVARPDPIAQPIEAPAAVDARSLRHQQTDAELKAAAARVAGDKATADLQAAIATTTGRLATEAESRAKVEQAAIDARFDALKIEEAKRADQAEVAADERRLRLWAALGVAFAVVAAVGLRLAGIPSQFAIPIPAAVAAGCVTLVIWPTISAALTLTVRYVLIASGCALALVVIVALGWLVRWLFKEWRDYGDRFRTALPEAAATVDALSRERQPAIIRWLIDLLHPKKPATAPWSLPVSTLSIPMPVVVPPKAVEPVPAIVEPTIAVVSSTPPVDVAPIAPVVSPPVLTATP